MSSGRTVYLIVDGAFKMGSKIYQPNDVFVPSDREFESIRGLGVSLMPITNSRSGRRLLKRGERITELPRNVLENIRTEAIQIAYHQEYKVPFHDVQKLKRDTLIEDIFDRKKRCRTPRTLN